MNDFSLWFTMGIQHICDLQGYDHILFIASLCILFDLHEWKKLLALITAFTIGHCITLALSVFNLLVIPASIIEILIPITIIITCITNILHRENPLTNIRHYYFSVLLFGFIHGMGFSYLLKSLLGSEENILSPLFLFNLGLETGQVIIVVFVLLISLILQTLTRLKKQTIIILVSGTTLCTALWMATDRTLILMNKH